MKNPIEFQPKQKFETVSNSDESVECGMEFMQKHCHEGVYSEDFGLRHGDSTGWATAYIARLMYQIDSEKSDSNPEVLFELQNSDGGWGYNNSVPSDADSTANALIFLKQNGLDGEERYSKAISYLKKYQHENGGISTYTQEDLKNMGYEGEGWSAPHVCVTALVAEVLEGEEREKAFSFLQNQRKPDGSFPAYWWASDIYATYQAMKILGGDSKMMEYFESVEYDNVFDLSMKIQGLTDLNLDTKKLVGELLSRQQRDGSWPSSPILKIPRPDIKPGEVTIDTEVVVDKNRLFSTVNALLALHMTRK